MNGSIADSRSDKESHRDTVQYEINMLAFCYEGLPPRRVNRDADYYLYIEGFLLHYRNLIEFFTGSNHRKDDLSMKVPGVWAGNLNPDQTLAAEDIQKTSVERILPYKDDISKYLQHCTEKRFEGRKEWRTGDMMRDIRPIIVKFMEHFPDE